MKKNQLLGVISTLSFGATMLMPIVASAVDPTTSNTTVEITAGTTVIGCKNTLDFTSPAFATSTVLPSTSTIAPTYPSGAVSGTSGTTTLTCLNLSNSTKYTISAIATKPVSASNVTLPMTAFSLVLEDEPTNVTNMPSGHTSDLAGTGSSGVEIFSGVTGTGAVVATGTNAMGLHIVGNTSGTMTVGDVTGLASDGVGSYAGTITYTFADIS